MYFFGNPEFLVGCSLRQNQLTSHRCSGTSGYQTHLRMNLQSPSLSFTESATPTPHPLPELPALSSPLYLQGYQLTPRERTESSTLWLHIRLEKSYCSELVI